MSVRVSFRKVQPAEYPVDAPYDPPSPIYDAVLAAIEDLGLDAEAAGTEAWNPFGSWVQPGGSIVIKPNFVTNRDREKVLDGDQLHASSTHPSVLRPLIDLAWRALKGDGTITVADSPIEGSDIEDTKRRLGFGAMLQELQARGINVQWLDLRDFGYQRHFWIDDKHFAGRSWNIGWMQHQRQPGDPRGYTSIDLGRRSLLEALENKRLLAFHKRDYGVAARHHRNGSHAYSLANTVLEADLLINVPKLKTHKKTGVTLALKSVIGLSNRKIWMPHFRRGWPPDGDEFDRQPSLRERMGNRLTRFPIWGGHTGVVNLPRLGVRPEYAEGGCHPGNQTLWRTVLDLNMALVYGRLDGTLAEQPQRSILHLVDGIIGGEGNGPLRAEARPSGVLLASKDPVALEAIAAEYMGFDSTRLPTVSEVDKAPLRLGEGSLQNIEVVGESFETSDPPYVPPVYWECLQHRSPAQ